jgi:hypothetical protein
MTSTTTFCIILKETPSN